MLYNLKSLIIRNIRINSYYLFFFWISFSGCLTLDTYHHAREDRKGDRLFKAGQTYLDSNQNLVVNFEAKFPDVKEVRPYHFVVNLDTLRNIYLKQRCNNRVYNPNFQEEYGIHSIYKNYENKRKRYVMDIRLDSRVGMVVELKRFMIKEGFLSLSVENDVGSQMRLEDRLGGLRYGKMYDENDPYVYERSMVFLFDQPIIPEGCYYSYDFVIFTLEPSEKRAYSKYLLLPEMMLIDIIALPINAIVYLIAAVSN